MYINRYIYEGGNPFLLPSLSHNITLGTTYKWVYLSAGYQYIKDAIISFSGAYSEDDPTIALINMINAPDYDKIFASLVLSPTMVRERATSPHSKALKPSRENSAFPIIRRTT